ncbi:MAG: aminotransferase [Gammaproteobacteria bacterium]|nr:aminotransferase [Gammaproteobacteria bacterium]MDH3466561.1 aminotransferase [Gammaproteobacteria bacterium]
MRTNFNYDTKDLWQKDRDHYIHPWTDFSVFKEQGSLVMAESEGVYVYDSDGNRYIDGIGGLWCVNIGYGSEEMAQAIADQVRRIPYYSTFTHLTTPPAAELAAKLAELAPGDLNHIFYSTGGSVANDTAIRIIHFYFNRLGKHTKKKIIARTDGYHGSTYLAMSMTGVAFDHQGFDLAPGLVHHISAPNCYRRPEGMSLEDYCTATVQELEDKILELGPENVACFIAEPIMGAGGVIVPPPGYHQRTQAVCGKYDVLYISDEVVTAFGRLGHFFASKDVFDLQPDIITSAKGISSGYVPLSATILSEEIYDVISVPQADGALFTHGFTYSGHPVSCAAGLKNIEIMERDNLCGQVRELGPYFETQLDTLRDLPIVGDVRGKCFMMCVENVADRDTKELFPAEVHIGNRIADHCEKRGLIIRPIAHLNVMSPPLTLTREQIDEFVSILRESIEATLADLKVEGIWDN